MTISKITQFKLLIVLIFANFAAMAESLDAEDARELIKSTAEQVITHVMQDRDTLEKNPDMLYGLVNTTIVPHIDFNRMSRWILGKNWRKASLTQKQRFADEFRKLLIRTYSTALVKFSDEEIVYLPIKEAVKNGRVTIKSEVRTTDGKRFGVDYRMHNKDKSWKVYDISVNGVSLISTYRSSFSTEIRRVGIDGLLSNLTNKNSGLNI